jgi:hypothetical protein
MACRNASEGTSTKNIERGYFPNNISIFHGRENVYMERSKYLANKIRKSTSYIVH